MKQMKTIYNIAKTELKTLFYSPIAWLVLIIFTIQVTAPYLHIIEKIIKNQTLGEVTTNITGMVFSGRMGIFNQVLKYIYLYIPLLTMGLMSREIASGSIKLLLSSPISSRQIVFGKFFAMMVYSLVLISPLIIFSVFSAAFIKDCDVMFIFSGILGIYFLICAYSAIGLYMSSLTSYQVVAAMGTLTVLAILNFMGKVGQDINFVRDLTYWLSIKGRAKDMVGGLITSEGIVYFITVIGMFLSFTIVKFQSGRIKNRLLITSRYMLVVVVGLLIGYATSRPSTKFYVDMTATKHRTLTPNSQEIIKKLDGGLTITTYINLLDFSRIHCMPKSINKDKARFQQYTRFKPEIEMKYVYYWDKHGSRSFYSRYPNMTDEEIAKKICETYNLDFDDFLRPEQLPKDVNLWSEGNRFVRVIQRENGQKTWLRIFHDMYTHPFESEISAALKRLIDKAPNIGFVVGHGERSICKYGDRNYSIATSSRSSRSSLLNQGFDFELVDLSKGDIDKDVSILVIADNKRDFTKKELDRVRKYVDNGGNLLIAAEPKHRTNMLPLVEMLGVNFVDGIMVKDNDMFIPTLIPATLTKEAVKNTSYLFEEVYEKGYSAIMPEALALDCSGAKDKGFEVIDFLKTGEKGYWNEKETTDFIDGEISLNTKIGEYEGVSSMGVALKRMVNNKEQRIFVLGDADCISNGELSAQHAGIAGGNFKIFTAMFEWLSNSQMPIDTRRPEYKDDEVKLDKASMFYWRILFMWLLPISVALLYLFIWIRRRKK